MPKKLQNLTGRKFGKWHVLRQAKTRQGKTHPLRYWTCICDCGTRREVEHSDLLFGKSTKCRHCKGTHGHKRFDRPTREYQTWCALKNRCLNPDNHAWPSYGGRGITVCKEWAENFETFLRDMGPKPKGLDIDRINNDGNYEPGNCRWTTRSENVKNTRPRKRNALGQFTSMLA